MGAVRGANGAFEVQWEDQNGLTSAFSQAGTSGPVLTLPPDFSGILRYFLTVNQAGCRHTDVLTIQKSCEDPNSSSCPETLSAHFDLNSPDCQDPTAGSI